MERKDFLRKFVFGTGLLIAAPAVFNACSKEDDNPDDGGNNNNNNSNDILVDLTKTEFAALKTVGGYAYTGNIIVIKSGESQYIALSKLCTHEGCTVNYSGTQVVCPCHNSKFDTSGSVLQGPATAALKKYTVVVEGNTLKIKD
ncbi:MAG TPA: Rieske (2Fe-2S) protein [Prolixibacteraceae bacterium]|mgnify:CR=1 FL=1|nr:Rieske (2Fe-2S) protein [Prolixibacteraceae bacterium]